MDAVVMKRFGGAEVLSWEECEEARPRPGEILVSVEAAGVNPIDVAIRCGGHYGVALPLIPGFDGAGRVEEAGTKSAASARETASIFPCGRKRARMPAEW